MSVPGTWNSYYDWTNSGSYAHDTVTFNGGPTNGTFSDSQGGSGNWSSHDGQLLLQYNNSLHTAYEGSIVDSAIVGISSTFTGSSGSWYAIKTTATAKPSAERTQKLSISGEPLK
jgi:hypothetical protein